MVFKTNAKHVGIQARFMNLHWKYRICASAVKMQKD